MVSICFKYVVVNPSSGERRSLGLHHLQMWMFKRVSSNIDESLTTFIVTYYSSCLMWLICDPSNPQTFKGTSVALWCWLGCSLAIDVSWVFEQIQWSSPDPIQAGYTTKHLRGFYQSRIRIKEAPSNQINMFMNMQALKRFSIPQYHKKKTFRAGLNCVFSLQHSTTAFPMCSLPLHQDLLLPTLDLTRKNKTNNPSV